MPMSLPKSFMKAVDSPSLLAGVRSSTGCYLDLGDFAMPVNEPAGGLLVHFLSDQCAPPRSATVTTTA